MCIRDSQLPDLIGIRLEEMAVDIVEVKTYRDNDNAFIIDGDTISGLSLIHIWKALEQCIFQMRPLQCFLEY